MKTKQFKFNYEEGYEYVPTPFDEKNLTTDMLEEFFFEYNCATNNDWNQIAGYGYIEGEQYLCEVEYSNNTATWQFLHMNYLEEKEVLDFAKNLKEYLKDDPTSRAFTVTVYEHELHDCDFQNKIQINFHAKVE